jgi:hypothetical protein
VTKPISPSEVGKAKTSRIPDRVIEAFNECISKHWDGGAATFTQDEVIRLVVAKMPEVERHTIFESKWLDVEDGYRAAGWQVEYDRPGYCETYEARFTFKRRTR